MLGEEIKITKNIIISIMNYYKDTKQWILGVTVNNEYQYFENFTKRTKYEFNIWLIFISIHITIYGKLKESEDK